MIEEMTCLLCPKGCDLIVRSEGTDITVEGNQCPKGLNFGRDEVLHPKRNLATSVPISGKDFQMLSLRLSRPVSTDFFPGILEEISRLRPTPPVLRGKILIENIRESGADVIATRSVKAPDGRTGKKRSQ